MMFESSHFAAGGFVSSLSTPPSDPSTITAKRRDNQPMHPVTVKQIVEATPSTEANFLIDGVDVYNVKLIGMVYDKSERVTDVSFVIDDGTGRIGCNKWVNDPHDTKEVEGLMEEIYIRVHGHLKISKGKKQLAIYAMRPVTDYNEVANHFLECVYAHCCNAKLQTQSNGSAANSAPSSFSSPVGNQAVLCTQLSQEYNLDGLCSIDKMVLDYLQQPSSLAQEKGVHKNEIAQKLKISEEKILEAMESLESEGLVYSTIDEFHYKSTAT